MVTIIEILVWKSEINSKPKENYCRKSHK